MSVNYNRLWKLLIDKKMKKIDLMKTAHISSNALAHLSKEEYVSDYRKNMCDIRMYTK